MRIEYSVCPEPQLFAANGVTIDGVQYKLAGQPPIATTKGWGNLAFMLRK